MLMPMAVEFACSWLRMKAGREADGMAMSTSSLLTWSSDCVEETITAASNEQVNE